MRWSDVTNRSPDRKRTPLSPTALLGACVALLAFAGPAAAQETEELPLSREEVDATQQPPDFCREGGEHPHFGPGFCSAFMQGGAAAAAAPDPGAAVHRSITSHPRYDEATGEIPHFCEETGAHPKFGQRWCSMTEEEWEAYRERQRRREQESGSSPPR